MDVVALLKALILWFGILVLAITNGAVREQVLIPTLGTVAGLVISGCILTACIFAVALAAVPWYGRLSSEQWWSVGIFWVVLTLIFEFSFGRLVQQQTWTEMLEAYRFEGGSIWPLVLVAALISPWFAARLRGAVRE